MFLPSLFALSAVLQQKSCVDCIHFKRDLLIGDKFGKCLLFPWEERNYGLVTGIKEPPVVNYEYCSVAREVDSMCGKKGKRFQPRPS